MFQWGTLYINPGSRSDLVQGNGTRPIHHRPGTIEGAPLLKAAPDPSKSHDEPNREYRYSANPRATAPGTPGAPPSSLATARTLQSTGRPCKFGTIEFLSPPTQGGCAHSHQPPAQIEAMSSDELFDRHVEAYDETLSRALRASGEGREFFAEGRVAVVGAIAFTPGLSARRRSGLWVR